MKLKSLFFAAFAAVVAVSCGPKMSDTTTITGDLGEGAPSGINISIPLVKVDTTITVTDGKFTVTVPASRISMGRMRVGNVIGPFVSDGTRLTLSVIDGKELSFKSDSPKKSVQEAFQSFNKTMSDFQEKYQPMLESATSTEEEDKVYEAYQSDVRDFCLKTTDANKDNVLAVVAIENLNYLLSTAQMDSVLTSLDPILSGNKTIAAMNLTMAANRNTGEGKMFSDFTIDDDKFSNYVGKGKYTLVDFWASWCGPCKKELPNLRNIYSKYAGEDFDMLSVAVWDEPQASLDSAKALGIVWNHMINGQKPVTDLYGIEGIPHIILFGPDGTILKRNLRGEGIETEIAKYVKPKN